MATKPTKVLIDKFFESPEYRSRISMRSLIDRDELYEYEKIAGKQFFDMSVDDLIGLINYFAKSKAKKYGNISADKSLNQLTSIARTMFNWYIDNEEIIKNPFIDSRLKARNLEGMLSEYYEVMNWDTVEKIIGKIRQDYDSDKAKYLECLIYLFYCGFSSVEEIVFLSEKDIDFRDQTVRLRGRTHHLSERCYELLIGVHAMENIGGSRGDYLMKSWRNNYFKYPIRPNRESDFDNRSGEEVGAILTRYMSVYINKKYGTKINNSNLYYLGFYDYVVSRVGKDRAKELITSYRISKDTKQLTELADTYGINPDSIFRLKTNMKIYV